MSIFTKPFYLLSEFLHPPKPIHKETQQRRDNREARRNRNRQYLFDVLKDAECGHCQESNPIVLEFNHIRGIKINNVTELVSQLYSIKAIQEEIDKCEILCANCHRIKTWERRHNAA